VSVHRSATPVDRNRSRHHRSLVPLTCFLCEKNVSRLLLNMPLIRSGTLLRRRASVFRDAYGRSCARRQSPKTRSVGLDERSAPGYHAAFRIQHRRRILVWRAAMSLHDIVRRTIIAINKRSLASRSEAAAETRRILAAPKRRRRACSTVAAYLRPAESVFRRIPYSNLLAAAFQKTPSRLSIVILPQPLTLHLRSSLPSPRSRRDGFGDGRAGR